jgi:hypothetical protein
LLRERHVADFVEKQRAAVGLRDLAGAAALARAGERAVLVAEQLGLDQRIGQRGAVDGDERAVGARRRLVQRAGEPFLAGAVWPRISGRSRPRIFATRSSTAAIRASPVSSVANVIASGSTARGRAATGAGAGGVTATVVLRASANSQRASTRTPVDSVSWNGAPGARPPAARAD